MFFATAGKIVYTCLLKKRPISKRQEYTLYAKTVVLFHPRRFFPRFFPSARSYTTLV
ncbi:hypothetical protein TSAR_002176 [Trichomalopsis sarcophagae]|uniref:Uncharacterized protein n=1 Tax=Trichomalopsis sarcophagae TaxID=543379 RepID=A0A232F924_9HYME|nr:hypothetical protein TSAR_002176 [Trichomalopsis sarcophagae]